MRKSYVLPCALLILLWMEAPRLQGQPTPFTTLAPGYTQEVFGVATIANTMGGVAFAADGDVWVKGCNSTVGPVRFDLARRVTVNGTSVHPLQAGATVTTDTGCGMTNHPDGRLYLNTFGGAQRLDTETGAGLGIMGLPGNSYGITVDPQTNRLVYPISTCAAGTTCTLVSVDSSTGNTQNLATFTAGASLEYVDGVSFDPTGNFIVVVGRTGFYPMDTPFMLLLNRNGTLVRQLPADHFPDGVAFHSNPFYFVANNNDGSVTRFDFPGDDLRAPPQQTVIASGGFRGDLAAVGPDGCYYVTQAGTRYTTGVTTGENSVVRICSTAGSFTPPPGVGPLAANAFGDTPLIAPNTWVSLKGVNLSPAGFSSPDCAPGYCWQSADFLSNRLPTQLNGVSVKVNGKSAYVYYISPTQVNILTPPDALPGAVQVQVTNGTTSYISTAQAQPLSLSFFEFVSTAGKHYVYGRHLADNTIIGPTSLFPGLTTPVKPGESIYVAANGFGPTDVPVVSGALTQGGTLPKPWPVVQIGGVPTTVIFAGLVSPGTFILNLNLPSNLPDGDLALTATYNGLSIQPNLLITVQH